MRNRRCELLSNSMHWPTDNTILMITDELYCSELHAVINQYRRFVRCRYNNIFDNIPSDIRPWPCSWPQVSYS